MANKSIPVNSNISKVVPLDNHYVQNPVSELSNVGTLKQVPVLFPTRKHWKAGQNIEKKINIIDLLPILKKAKIIYKLNENRVYKVYKIINLFN